MFPSLQAYDALPSETASTSQILCEPESQMSREKVDQSTMPPTSNQPMRTWTSWFWTSWKWESAACLLVLATPIIIFATLYLHSGQPLPQWPFKVSINSLLSVYALVIKASIGFILTSCIGQLQWAWFSETRPLTDMLAFDSATRGADGALGLIWRQRFRQPLTALGCIIMILAVAVDPFVQQLVRPMDCSVEVLGGIAAATLPRSNVFQVLGFDGGAEPRESTGIMSMRGMRFESSMYDAIFSPGRDPPWQCSTGNCSFTDTYGTIGICHSCQDVSTDVLITVTCWNISSTNASYHPTSGMDCPSDSVFTVESNITFESNIPGLSNFDDGKQIMLGTTASISPHGYRDSGNDVAAAAFSELEHEGSTWATTKGLIFGFLNGATANGSSGGSSGTAWTTSHNSNCDANASDASWGCQGFGAATCSLKPCVQVYNATISAGVLEEHLVASSSDTAWGIISDKLGLPLYLALIDTQCHTEITTPLNRSSSVATRWLPYNLNLTDPNFEPSTTDPGGFDIQFPEDVISLLESGCLYIMQPVEIMYQTSNYLRGKVEVDYWDNVMEDGEVVAATPEFRGPDVIRSIYNWGHIDFERLESAVANISDSLTTYIRTHSGSTQSSGGTNFPRDVQGKVYHYATCLQVQWPWLSYPASLSVLTTLFFLMVVEATRRQGASIWKASPLAWVLRVEGPGNETLSSDGSCKKMKERATQIAVNIVDGDLDGPHIRMADLKDPNLL